MYPAWREELLASLACDSVVVIPDGFVNPATGGIRGPHCVAAEPAGWRGAAGRPSGLGPSCARDVVVSHYAACDNCSPARPRKRA